jgi:hypothetical protein
MIILRLPPYPIDVKYDVPLPNTDYLFANLQKENAFEKSMKKMDLVNSLDIFSKK